MSDGGPRLPTAVRSVSASEGELRFSVEIAGRERDLRFDIDPPIVPNADVTIPAVLLPAMTQGAPLRLAQPVDPGLLRNLPDLQAIFSAWAREWPYPQGLPREIEVDAVPAHAAPLPADRGVAAFFSGGVDSFSTLLSHPEITHLIFVHGLDLPLERRELAVAVIERLADAAHRLGKSWITVETDARRLGDEFVPWVGYFGSILASVARLLSPIVSRVYVASESPYRGLYRRGSHPLIDHLWGGDAVDIVYDGARFTRAEKVTRIAGDEVARRALRVCWENRGSAYNCCRCEKCLRTMVALEALGVLAKFETFREPLDLDAVAAVVPGKAIERDFWEENLRLASDAGSRPLARAIEAGLANAQPRPAARIAELEAIVAARDSDLRGITESASWRLTAPLRGGKSMVGRNRRRDGPQ
jgi:hypothetical protein